MLQAVIRKISNAIIQAVQKYSTKLYGKKNFGPLLKTKNAAIKIFTSFERTKA